MKFGDKIIWGLFAFSAVFAFGSNLAFAGLDKVENGQLTLLSYGLPFAAVYAHAWRSLGLARSAFLLLLSVSVGLVFEIIGVNFGTIFGSSYSYNMPGPVAAGVPLVIPLFWFVFAYTAYSLVNWAVYLGGGALPEKRRPARDLLFMLILADAILITMIDLVLDPVMVAWGEWNWTGNGFYYGIPWENFGGWFLIGLIVSSVFRTFEYFKPKMRNGSGSIVYIPALGYFFIILSFSIFAGMLSIRYLPAIAVLLYLPFAILLLAFIKKFSAVRNSDNTECCKNKNFSI